MDDRLSSLPPYPSGPDLPLARPGYERVLSRVLCGMGGAALGFLGGVFGSVGLCAGGAVGPESIVLDIEAMVALFAGVAGAALGAWVGARLG